MSRDLDAALIDELELGCHRARNTQNGQELRDAHEPLFSDAAALFFAVLILAVLGACVIWYAFPTPSLPHMEQKQ